MSITDILSSPFLVKVIIRALAVGIPVSLCAAILGVSLVLKRYSMIGDGLSHVGFLGMAIAACASGAAAFSTEISVPIVIIAAVLILRISGNEGRLNGDAACAVVSTGAVAVGTLLYNLTGGRSGDICTSLFGSASVVTLSAKDIILSLALCAAVIAWFLMFEKTMFSFTFDETFARAAGVKTDAFGLILAVLTGVTIVVGMKLMGSMMISALIIFPALTAMRFTGSFRGTVLFASVESVLAFIIGLFAACMFSLQTGAAVVTVELAVFLVSCAVRKK